MRDGAASETARRVAALRLHFDRVPAPYGDPAADDALARDVAGSLVEETAARVGEGMVRYLQGRTRFFDRLVVDAIAGGITQIVVVAAGYDGRALRYEKPGVRWFELDHPSTQSDKRRRLHDLGLGADHVAFVAADFDVDDVRAALSAGDAALDPGGATLFTVEGVAVYLTDAVLRRLLTDLRAVAGPGSLIAISAFLAIADQDDEMADRRARFRARVATVGEPVRSTLDRAGFDALLVDTGWRPRPADEGVRRAGFVVADAT